jgi:uncharacterized protein
MQRLIILVLAISLIGAACNRPQTPAPEGQGYSNGTIHLADRTISYELADTLPEKQKGLSGRSGLEENQGMLFAFPTPDFPSFWMKDMNFAIDIVWIRGDEVVDITADAQPQPGIPDFQLRTYSPKTPADRVLELKEGWASRNGLKIGDKIEILQLVGS